MSNVPSDTPRSALRQSERTSIDVGEIAKAARLELREEAQTFELPARLFEQLPFAIYICDRDGLVLRYNGRAAELWGRSPKLGDPNERYCGSYQMYRPDGRLLPHHECPMADVLRNGVSVREAEVHIQRPNGSRGIALVDIEAVKDGDGNIVGAVNCFQDITERKQAEAREKTLGREMDHRAKNLLSLVQATVQLTQADTIDDFKAAIGGRLQALANAHSLLAESRWAGASLRGLVVEELAPYSLGGISRAQINGPELVLEPKSAQTIAVVLHELTTNAVKYGALSVPTGRLLIEWSRGETELVIRWSELGGPPVMPPSRQGFGTRVVGRVVQAELAGKLQVNWNSGGLVFELTIPLVHLAGTLSP